MSTYPLLVLFIAPEKSWPNYINKNSFETLALIKVPFLLLQLHVCSAWSGKDIIPSLYAGMTFITVLLHPLLLRPSNPISTCLYRSAHLWIFFSLGFFSGFPLFWSAVLKLSCWLATAEQCERIISATAASVPLCTLQRGVHLFLWQGATARDAILRLRIKMLSWRTLSFSSFSSGVCAADYFCLRIVLGTCPCEFFFFLGYFLDMSGPLEF